ncbi:hypothetical protein [Mesoterricola sediminis]|uniref:Phage protein n=1 Tax=Mesoterricola sediminis TaxID=2927980 RepID=A0AA48KBN1_9BACT|nr:hypothetical protein [Mesoterricola sediminis]BDU76294.1 hypothetical protein METESE_12520 [Mesoterricola sediminis]
MAFKMKYATKAEVPAELQPHFVEKDGAWVADTEVGEHPSFIAVREKKDELLGEVKKVKAEREEARSAVDQVKTALGITDLAELPNALKGKASAGKEEVEKIVTERVAAFKAESEKQVKALTDQNNAAQAQLQVLLIDNAITAEATKAGIAPTAMQDVLLRGQRLFKVVEGKPVPMDGEKVIYGKDGVNPMPVSEWMGRLTTEAPHLFNPSQGGGAKPGEGGRQPVAGNVRSRADLKNDAEKAKFITDHGVDAYKALPATA